MNSVVIDDGVNQYSKCIV